jgi:hypothetical protein
MKETIYQIIKQEINKGMDLCDLEFIRIKLNAYTIKYGTSRVEDSSIIELLESKFKS